MKINDIKFYGLKQTLDKPFAASQGWHNTRTASLVKVITDQGVEGWGECYGAYPEVVKSIIETLWKPLLLGKDPFDNEVLWESMYKGIRGNKGALMAAISGLDIALWDIKGKVLGVPISKILGGTFRNSIKCYVTGMYMTKTDDLAGALIEEARGYIDDGFDAIKMRIGYGLNLDVEIVSAVREAIGDEICLMVDANCAYDSRTAIHVGRRLDKLNVYWFEEPVPPTDIEGYLEVKNALDMYIAGGELEFGKYGFKDFIGRRAADIIQPDMCWAGGITETKKIATLCETFGVRCLPHVWGTPIAIAANLQLIASLPSLYSINDPLEPILELDQSPNLFRDHLAKEPIIHKNSRISVPQKPGLGVEIDEDFIKEYAVDM